MPSHVTVIVSNDAFRQMLSSALEAYACPDGKRHKGEGHIPLETYGSIWGYSTIKVDGTYFHVVVADPDTSADRRPGSVQAKVASSRIKAGFYARYNPELAYLGDFHSHPYSPGEFDLKTAQHVEKRRLFRFSGAPGQKEGDFASVKSLKKQGLMYRVGLVVTVFKMPNCVTEPLHNYLDSKSAIRFTHNGPDGEGRETSYRCWLKAYAFLGDDEKPIPNKDLRVHCGALGMVPWVY